MPTFAKDKLSSSSAGRQIKVVAVATVGTAIHTGGATAPGWDEVWLFATNHHTVAVTVTVEFGGATAPDDLIKRTLQVGEGAVLVVPGLILQGTLTVKAFASVANVVTIGGYVNRIGA